MTEAHFFGAGRMLTGKVSFLQVGGIDRSLQGGIQPVGMSKTAYRWEELLLQFLSLSVVLMVFNLLPIPPLDGFRAIREIALMCGLRWSRETEIVALAGGFLFVIAYTIYLLFFA
jgi:Zn-dependent protease